MADATWPAADDAFMGALEAAERELKATGGAGSSSSAQTPATDAAEEAGVSHSPAGGAGDEPYAASDDEPMSPPEVPPTTAAASSEHAEGERSGERSGRGSERRRESGESRSGGEVRSGESRSTFKARVIKEVKTALHGFFSAGRIASKEDFKELARDLAHKILSKDPKKTSWDERMPARVQKYVEQLFARDFIYDPSRNKTRKDAKEPKPKVAK
uniref:Set2 Rpb1 interacting domain-containing protein n=1 Tax=Phaeocystis antarctica TaxID=33657 RepID=A0A7S0I6P5_9EUKA|mmetsp:Transcript_9837/g.23138  ORF Transcript_9837/g.23138 Transcript_9837/m.23138 type:complete len:215 (+) Transcript_9837:100-744(+)